MTQHYNVTVVGRTWEGFNASNVYSFDHLPAEFEIRRKAGDFETVTDWEIESVNREVQIRTGGQVSTETITRAIVRPFKEVQPWNG